MGTDLHARATQPARFCVVGAAGYAVNLGLYSALVTTARVQPLPAAAVAFAVAVVHNYILNRVWTFRVERGGFFQQALRFGVVSVAALVLNLLLLSALLDAGLGTVAAQVVAVVVVSPVSFLANRTWSFSTEGTHPVSPSKSRASACRPSL